VLYSVIRIMLVSGPTINLVRLLTKPARFAGLYSSVVLVALDHGDEATAGGSLSLFSKREMFH